MQKRFNTLKRVSTFMLLALVILTTLIPNTAYALSVVQVTTGDSGTEYFEALGGSGSWNGVKTPLHWVVGSNDVAYCLQHKKDSPLGGNYSETELTDFYSTRVVQGLQIILEYGYPCEKPADLTVDQARYATANAIRFWLAENGDSDQYNSSNRRDYGSNLRAKSGYQKVLDYADDLLAKARAQKLMEHTVSFSPSTITLTVDGSYFVGTTKVSLKNCKGGYKLDKSTLPSGTQITGDTGSDGDTLTIKVPVASGNQTITLKATGLDDRVTANIFMYASANNSVQNVITVGSAGYHSAGEGTVTINTPAYGKIQVNKTDSDSGTWLSGAVFGIYSDAACKKEVARITTNSSGTATSGDLIIGTYYLKEITPPSGYVLSHAVYTAKVTTNATTKVNADNAPSTGQLIVVKVAEDGQVSGITFRLYGKSLAGEDVDETATTNTGGVATFKNIPISGDTPYTVEEVGTSGQYATPEPQTVSVSGGGTTLTFSNVLKRGDLRVTKTSEDGLVAGMRFHLYGTALSGEPIDEYAVTDASGVAEFNNILVSEAPYTLEEVDTPIRYVIPPAQSVVVTDGGVTEVSVRNILKKWRVTVTKSDREVGERQGDAKFSGAVYGIYDGERLVDTYTTDANGQFTTIYYICGDNFSVREITPSEGYLLDDTSYHIGAEARNFVIEFNSITNAVTEQVKKGTIWLIKHTDNGETQIETPEEGAVFQIYLASSGSYNTTKERERETLVCNDYGFAQTKLLPYGVYVVHQVSGWDGRELMRDFKVFIKDDGVTYRYLINNYYFESYIKVVKKDIETGEQIPYAGAGFQIYKPNGSLVTMRYTYPTVTIIDTFYTNEEGYLVTPEKLDYGIGYKLVEVQAPYGYTVDSTPVKFDVKLELGEDEYGVTVIPVEKPNMAQKGVINVSKSGEKLDHATQASGIYQPVYKEQMLSSAMYEIIAAEDITTPDGTIRAVMGEIVDTLITDSNGKAQSCELYLGKYDVIERIAPHGMALNEEPITAELTYAGQEIKVTGTSSHFHNERQRVEVELEKAMEQDTAFGNGQRNEIFDVTFGLFAADDIYMANGEKIPLDALLEIVRVDKDGHGSIQADLPFGSYYFKELSTNAGYLLNNLQYPFTFQYEGQDIPVVRLAANDGEPIENILKRGKIKGLKIDEDGKMLGGALIGLFKHGETKFTEETAIQTCVSANDGTFSFDSVPYGQWTVRELSPPKGYILSTTIFPVNVSADNLTIRINIQNKFIRGSIKLTKVDSENRDNRLSGAVFMVFADSNGNGELDWYDRPMGTLKEFEEGVYSMPNLRYGRYFIREISSPTGYMLSNTIHQVEITKNGVAVEITVTNRIIRGTVRIKKVDADELNTKLSGAEFQIYADTNGNGIIDSYDKLAGTFQEVDKGIYEMPYLRYGRYFIMETVCPKGYLITQDIVEVDIKSDGELIELTITNRPIRGTIGVMKVDEDYPDKLLSGAVFEVYADVKGNKVFDEDAKFLGIMEEMDTGVYELSGLRYGGYFCREQTAPEGYNLDENAYYFEIVMDGQSVSIDNGEKGRGFHNKVFRGDLRIIKDSIDGRKFGFTFEVKSADGSYRETLTTDTAGVIELKGLRVGKYVVSEIRSRASIGYIIPDVAAVEINTGETAVVQFFNDKPTAPTPTPAEPTPDPSQPFPDRPHPTHPTQPTRPSKPVPQTSDDSTVSLWLALFCLAVVICAASFFFFIKLKGKVHEKAVTPMLLGLALIVAFTAFCAVMLIRESGQYVESVNVYDELSQYLTFDNTPETQDGIADTPQTDNAIPENNVGNGTDTEPQATIPLPTVDFDALRAINPDITAWLISDDTEISYPVAQGADNSYYLKRLYNRKSNKAGCLFLDYENSPNFEDKNTIIYGHNMNNGSMFADLLKYQEQDYYDAHPTMILLTPNGSYMVELFAAYVASPDEAENADSSPWAFEWESEAAYSAWLKTAQDRSVFKSDVSFTQSDRILTLSTCISNGRDRFIVVSKLIPMD